MQISKNVFRIDETFANVYVINASGKIVQIDSGMKGQFERIRGFYGDMGLRPDIVILTHSHMDHIGELAGVVREYSPAVYAHREEIPVIKGERKLHISPELIRSFGPMPELEPVKEVRDLRGLSIPRISVIETPGHTPGSITVVYQDDAGKYAFAGDVAYEEGGRLLVHERYSLDVETLRKSYDKIIELRPVTVLPGHGNPVRL